MNSSNSVNENVIAKFNGTITVGDDEHFLGFSKYYKFGACQFNELNAITINKKTGKINISLDFKKFSIDVKEFLNGRFYVFGKIIGLDSTLSFQVSSNDFSNWLCDESGIDIYFNLPVNYSSFFKRHFSRDIDYEIIFKN